MRHRLSLAALASAYIFGSSSGKHVCADCCFDILHEHIVTYIIRIPSTPGGRWLFYKFVHVPEVMLILTFGGDHVFLQK